ncbi:MAG: metallophosphoesterase [Herpetosiphon sp.]
MPRERGSRRFVLRIRPEETPPARILVNPRWQWASALLGSYGALLLLQMAATYRRRDWHRCGRWLAALGVLGAVRGVFEALIPQLRRHTLAIPQLPRGLDGLTIGQLSDLHLNGDEGVEVARRAIRKLATVKPDIVVVTGDFVTHVVDKEVLHAVLGEITAPYGVYGIWGNHDYWVNTPRLKGIIEAAGIAMLVNESRVIEYGGERLYLAGVDDQWEGACDLDRALCGIPQSAPVVLLAHEPDLADVAAERGVQLQLSGHAHGGHINVPWLGGLLLPRFARQYTHGLYRCRAMWLYVSRGLGGFPFRLGTRTEVTVFTLVREERP